MKAELLLKERFELAEGLFVEIVVWRVPGHIRGSAHEFKYRLAMVDRGQCVLRYDNEAGKGDHKHVGMRETPYDFRGLDELQVDFWNDVSRRLKR
jgi:hypothetical protein